MVKISRPLKLASGITIITLLLIGGVLLSPLFMPTPPVEQGPDQPEGTVLLEGVLQEVDAGHKGSGTVQLVQFESGNQSVRFVEVSITNGPDLYVYLSKKSSFSGTNADPGDFVSLGLIPATSGNFSVEVLSDINGTEYSSVLIWCQAFSVLFTYAIFE